MFVSEGVDTFCILPITVAEGNQTVWNMPKRIGLPDNAGSWRMVGEHDVATRFSTALGRDPRMTEAILDMLGAPSEGDGILLLAHGSELSMSAKTAEYYAEALRLNGWKAECGFARFGSDIQYSFYNFAVIVLDLDTYVISTCCRRFDGKFVI